MLLKNKNEQKDGKNRRRWQIICGGIALALSLTNCADSSSSGISSRCQSAKEALREAQSDYDTNYQRQSEKTYVDRETINSVYQKQMALNAAQQAKSEACSEEKADSVSSPETSEDPSSATTSPPKTIEASQSGNKFSLPQTTCGDTPTGGDSTWYPVFIDGANLDIVRTNYCSDAVATKRKSTGVDTVQLASFTSRERALALAQAVGGEVGEPTITQADSASNESVSQDASVADSSNVQSEQEYCTASLEQVKGDLSAITSINYLNYNDISQGDKVISQVAQTYQDPKCESLKSQIQQDLKLVWRLHLNKKYQVLIEAEQSRVSSGTPCYPSSNIVSNFTCSTLAATNKLASASAATSIAKLNQQYQEEIQTMESFF